MRNKFFISVIILFVTLVPFSVFSESDYEMSGQDCHDSVVRHDHLHSKCIDDYNKVSAYSKADIKRIANANASRNPDLYEILVNYQNKIALLRGRNQKVNKFAYDFKDVEVECPAGPIKGVTNQMNSLIEQGERKLANVEFVCLGGEKTNFGRTVKDFLTDTEVTHSRAF